VSSFGTLGANGQTVWTIPRPEPCEPFLADPPSPPRCFGPSSSAKLAFCYLVWPRPFSRRRSIQDAKHKPGQPVSNSAWGSRRLVCRRGRSPPTSSPRGRTTTRLPGSGPGSDVLFSQFVSCAAPLESRNQRRDLPKHHRCLRFQGLGTSETDFGPGRAALAHSEAVNVLGRKLLNLTAARAVPHCASL